MIGSYFYYTKTGYRDGLKDSTGLIRFEQLLGVASIGLQYGLQVSDVVAFGVRTGVNWTTNSLSQELKVYDQSIYNESYKLEASGFEIQPFLKVGIPLNDWWEVYGEAGYNIDINNEFKLDGDETDIKPDWSGFRVSLGIGFKLN